MFALAVDLIANFATSMDVSIQFKAESTHQMDKLLFANQVVTIAPKLFALYVRMDIILIKIMNVTSVLKIVLIVLILHIVLLAFLIFILFNP